MLVLLYQVLNLRVFSFLCLTIVHLQFFHLCLELIVFHDFLLALTVDLLVLVFEFSYLLLKGFNFLLVVVHESLFIFQLLLFEFQNGWLEGFRLFRKLGWFLPELFALSFEFPSLIPRICELWFDSKDFFLGFFKIYWL